LIELTRAQNPSGLNQIDTCVRCRILYRSVTDFTLSAKHKKGITIMTTRITLN